MPIPTFLELWALFFKAIFDPAGDLYVQVNVASYLMQRRFQVPKRAAVRGCEYLHWQFSETTSQFFAHSIPGFILRLVCGLPPKA
jgi:hypothetical protein